MPDYVGLMPAAGEAQRIHGLPKYLLPTAGDFLLRRMYNMMSTSARPVIITSQKNHAFIQPYIKYDSVAVLPRVTDTMTQTILHGRQMAGAHGRAYTLFGMPDTYFEDIDAFNKLRRELESGAGLVVGHFETRPEQRAGLGMCAFNDAGDLIAVMDKQEETYLTRAWGVLAWAPEFWQYLTPDMPHVGYGIEPAIKGGLDVRAVAMGGRYWDCGTVAEYAHMLQSTVIERELA